MVSDKKLFIDNTWQATVLSAQDYYPFGMSMPNRKWQSSSTYRFDFNGKEKDPETELNDFGARFYAANIGRWLSIDPFFQKYLSHSPYHFGYCNPIITIDPNGEENIVVIGGADVSGKDRYKFMATGLKAFQELSAKEPKEQTTLVVCTAYMTAEEQTALKEQAQKLASGMYDVVFVNSASELTDYFNLS